MTKKGDWFVGDYVIQTTGLDQAVPGQDNGYGGGYRDGMVAVLSALKGAVPKHVLNAAFEKAVACYRDRSEAVQQDAPGE